MCIYVWMRTYKIHYGVYLYFVYLWFESLLVSSWDVTLCERHITRWEYCCSSTSELDKRLLAFLCECSSECVKLRRYRNPEYWLATLLLPLNNIVRIHGRIHGVKKVMANKKLAWLQKLWNQSWQPICCWLH